MSVYEWMFQTPYFFAIVIIGCIVMAITALQERADRQRREQNRRIAERRERLSSKEEQ